MIDSSGSLGLLKECMTEKYVSVLKAMMFLRNSSSVCDRHPVILYLRLRYLISSFIPLSEKDRALDIVNELVYIRSD